MARVSSAAPAPRTGAGNADIRVRGLRKVFRQKGSGLAVVAIERLPFSIGRRSLSDLVLVDPDVSRDHAEIINDINGGLQVS